MYLNSEVGEKLRGVKQPVLDKGFVCLVDWMGDDSAIANAARVSYGSTAKTPADDIHLIRYLMKHHHMTPFEMAELKFMIRMPMDSWRQMVRHRTASINEQSSRYSVVEDMMAETQSTAWRKQSDTNRQGSGSPLDEKTGEILSADECELHRILYNTYQHRIGLGVAREQARKDLPLSTYTTAYWKIDLRNLLHFLGLRMAPDAQYEIRQYAIAISSVVEALFPVVWEAFEIFRLDSITFDDKECSVLSSLLRHVDPADLDEAIRSSRTEDWFKEGSRNRKEFVAKLGLLGLE